MSYHGVDGPGIESRWVGGADLPHSSNPVLVPYTVGTGSFPGIKRPRNGVDHPPNSTCEVNGKTVAVPLLLLWTFMARSRVKFTL